MSMLSIASHERDLVRWRPDYVVSHVDLPVYDARTTRITYTKILARLPRAIQGVWVLKDVHIVDAYVAELMAWFQKRWTRGALHLILLSPTPEAAMQWAAYIGCDKPTMMRSVSKDRVGRRLIANMPAATVVQLSNWIQEQSLKGDVLVFARSAAHRDAMCEAWTCCNLQVPVHKVESYLPHHNGSPRVLVGTPTLDHMLDSIISRRIQHVIDFGRVYKLRQDTGNDWEEAFITQSMAEGRLAAAQSSAPGLCVRVYAAEGSLSTDTLATHKLSHDLCRAQLMIRCGPQALTRFPIALQEGNTDPSVAIFMIRLQVEKQIATILHVAPTLDVGIGIAAIIGRHTGPYPKNHYEACVQGSMPANTKKHVSAWAHILGRSAKKVVEAVSKTTWDEVLPVIFQGYQSTIALAVGDRKEYIDVTTGDILQRPPYLSGSSETEAIVYTHRQENRIVSSLPIPVSWATRTLQRTRVRSPVRLENDVLVLAMQAWFETKRVVAWRVSPTEVELACGDQVDLSDVVAEWTDSMRRKALDTPLVVPLAEGDGQSMNMIFTGGMRFSDAFDASDFIVMKCDLETLTKPDLLFLHKTPGAWRQGATPSMILGTRKEAEGLWDHMENVMVRALDTEYQRFQPCQVVVRLVVKVYRGKSTGRAVVHGSAGKEWLSHVEPAWQWEVHEDVDLVSLYSRNAPTAATVCNIPEHMDEMDIAALLQLDPRHIILERTVQLLTQLPCVTRFFRALGSDEVIKATRTLRYTEVFMDIEETNLEKTLRLVYDLLPTTNNRVNQPLRAHWSLLTTTGSHPSALIARAPTTVIPVTRHEFAKELETLRTALASATRLATYHTPSLSWCPALAVPWIDAALPLVEGSRGPLFRLYGSEEDKERSRQELRRLADETPDPAPGKYEVCPICLDPTASHTLAICGCRFCPPCLAQAFEIKCMDDAFLGEIQCPTCKERVSTEDLALFLRPKTLRIYATRIATFLSSRIPDVIRECPGKCGVFGRVRATPHQQTFDCRQCNASWCIRCSDKAGTAVQSHQGFCDKRWDSDYWKAFAEEAALAGARSCPQCGTYVAKDGGCSHVSCVAPNCHTHFCWKCVQAFSHVQLSPPAQGVIQTIQGDLVTIAVDQDTWNTPCHTPAPKVVTYRAAHARSMLLENQVLKTRARLWVYSYVYDHLDACACT